MYNPWNVISVDCSHTFNFFAQNCHVSMLLLPSGSANDLKMNLVVMAAGAVQATAAADE